MTKVTVRERRDNRPRAGYRGDTGRGPSGRQRRRRHILCAPCTFMFSEKGLINLNSLDGFAHHTRDQFKTSGTNGCALCRLIFDLASWRAGARWASDARLIFRNQSIASEYDGSGIDVLQGDLEDAPDILRIYPFAKACRYPLTTLGDVCTIDLDQPIQRRR